MAGETGRIQRKKGRSTLCKYEINHVEFPLNYFATSWRSCPFNCGVTFRSSTEIVVILGCIITRHLIGAFTQ